MEMLMEYHLLFMVMSFCLLVISILFLIEDNTKEKTMFAMLLCGINIVLCTVCYLGFFGIGILTIQNGVFTIEIYPGMYPIFGFFWLLYWVNIVFVFYCYYKWVNNPLDADFSE